MYYHTQLIQTTFNPKDESASKVTLIFSKATETVRTCTGSWSLQKRPEPMGKESAGDSCWSPAVALPNINFHHPWQTHLYLNRSHQINYQISVNWELPQVSMVCPAQIRSHHWLMRNVATAWAEQGQHSLQHVILRQWDTVPEEPPTEEAKPWRRVLTVNSAHLFPQKPWPQLLKLSLGMLIHSPNTLLPWLLTSEFTWAW